MMIRDAPPNLEDDDLLEMVNAGLIPAVVVDDYLAAFWKKIFRASSSRQHSAAHWRTSPSPSARQPGRYSRR
jgi:hypothetical protein